jgi:hypothetical protein
MKKLNGLTAVALTYFLGELVIDIIMQSDGTIIFYTVTGITGFVEYDLDGNAFIYIGEEAIYEIEHELFEIFYMDIRNDIFKLYEYIEEIRQYSNFKHKSKMFSRIVLDTLNKIINGKDVNKNSEMFRVGTDVVKVFLN